MTHFPTPTTAAGTSSLCSWINSEWRGRPEDERYKSLEELHAACLERADRSSVTVSQPNRIEPVALPVSHDDAEMPIGQALDKGKSPFVLHLETEAGRLDMSHWAFGQIAAAAQVPTTYLRKIDTRLVAALLDYGLTFLSKRESHSLFVESRPDTPGLQRLRAWTSPTYGRIYDHDVVDMVLDTVDTEIWRPPCHEESGTADSLKATTLYLNDRGSWIFLVDDRNPIEIRVEGRTEVLCRGFLVRNSEVGFARFEVLCFYYRYTCANRLLWTPTHVQKLGIRHTSGAPERFRREARGLLSRFAGSDASEVRDRVERAMRLDVGRDRETVTQWLQKQGFTRKHAQTVHDRAMGEEGRARCLWDLIQGGTATARDRVHTDERLKTEERFGALFSRVTA